jgi:hypothetical protein
MRRAILIGSTYMDGLLRCARNDGICLLAARLLTGDTQITHLPPYEQGPCAYQYQHLDELERHGALAIGALA